MGFNSGFKELKTKSSIAQFSPRFKSRGSVMRIVTRLDVRGNRSWVSGRGKSYISLQCVHNGPGPIPFSIGGYFSGRKSAEVWAWKVSYLVPNFRVSGATSPLRAQGHVTFTLYFDLWLLHHVHNTDGWPSTWLKCYYLWIVSRTCTVWPRTEHRLCWGFWLYVCVDLEWHHKTNLFGFRDFPQSVKAKYRESVSN